MKQGWTDISDYLEMLACPECLADLEMDLGVLRCVKCSAAYPIEDGIPVLLPTNRGEGDDGGLKEDQADFFDEAVDEEFEIERPHGTPSLYPWLLQQKFDRSLRGLGSARGRTALVVCAGSGMDAEFLARAGMMVVASDISLGAMRRCKERSARHHVPLAAVVADVEHLPFKSESVGLSYVHDGLHHLEQPALGLAEMLRVARDQVSVTEPAQAAATSMAVRLGLSVEIEEAGNRVARMKIQDIKEQMAAAGFRVAEAHRYAMFYRHEPGSVMRWLSKPGWFGVGKAAWRAGNMVLGPVGNKLSVTGVR